jgi:hypothetical protein
MVHKEGIKEGETLENRPKGVSIFHLNYINKRLHSTKELHKKSIIVQN